MIVGAFNDKEEPLLGAFSEPNIVVYIDAVLMSNCRSLQQIQFEWNLRAPELSVSVRPYGGERPGLAQSAADTQTVNLLSRPLPGHWSAAARGLLWSRYLEPVDSWWLVSGQIPGA